MKKINCRKCKEDKPEKEFLLLVKKGNIRGSYCKHCQMIIKQNSPRFGGTL